MKKTSKLNSVTLEDRPSEIEELLSQIETTQVEETQLEEALLEETQINYVPISEKISDVKNFPPKIENQRVLNPMRIAILSW